MVHQSTEQDRDDWATRCEISPVPELVRFARGLRAEWPHVVAGLTHPASNGQTEGQISKLKAIKRQMYDTVGELKIATRMHGLQQMIDNTFSGFDGYFLSSPTVSCMAGRDFPCCGSGSCMRPERLSVPPSSYLSDGPLRETEHHVLVR